ncbi:unnamed protein product, partial [Amoebophrya sp. A120]
QQNQHEQDAPAPARGPPPPPDNIVHLTEGREQKKEPPVDTVDVFSDGEEMVLTTGDNAELLAQAGDHALSSSGGPPAGSGATARLQEDIRNIDRPSRTGGGTGKINALPTRKHGYQEQHGSTSGGNKRTKQSTSPGWSSPEAEEDVVPKRHYLSPPREDHVDSDAAGRASPDEKHQQRGANEEIMDDPLSSSFVELQKQRTAGYQTELQKAQAREAAWQAQLAAAHGMTTCKHFTCYGTGQPQHTTTAIKSRFYSSVVASGTPAQAGSAAQQVLKPAASREQYAWRLDTEDECNGSETGQYFKKIGCQDVCCNMVYCIADDEWKVWPFQKFPNLRTAQAAVVQEKGKATYFQSPNALKHHVVRAPNCVGPADHVGRKVYARVSECHRY